ncbi:MAG: hypothetical protein K6G61_04455 [Solobacterium sp.]|nr:hypothetical protein [Solobacterium sp.]
MKEIKLPALMTGSGRLIYSEPSNPYETIEVYAEDAEQFSIKLYISEHGPDGGNSFRVIVMDREGRDTLEKLAGGDITGFLRRFWTEKNGMSDLGEFLDQNGISYKQGWYF